MQKDLAEATERLADGLNDLHGSKANKNLMSLVNKQAEEIDRRGQIVMQLQDSIRLQQENINKLLMQNKHLESLVEDMKSERQKLLEEIKELKESTKKTRAKRAAKKTTKAEEKQDDTQAA